MTNAILLATVIASWADFTTIHLTDRDQKPYDGVIVRAVASQGRNPAFSFNTVARGNGRYEIQGRLPAVDQVLVRADLKTAPPQTKYVSVLRKHYKQWPPIDIALSIARGELVNLLPPQDAWISAGGCRYAGVETLARDADGMAINLRALWHVPRQTSAAKITVPSYRECWPIYTQVEACYSPW